MARPHKADKLLCNDLLFIAEYLGPSERNATEAYQRVHPKSSRRSARSRAAVVLNKPTVQAEIQRRLNVIAHHATGYTRDLIEKDLLWCRETLLREGNAIGLAQVSMDAAKLGGFLVEKREQVNIDAHKGLMRASILELMQTQNEQPVPSPSPAPQPVVSEAGTEQPGTAN